MSCIILILLIWNYGFITGFVIKSHFPTSSSSHYPRLRMTESFPSLQQFTICSWMKFYSNDNELFTLISYATSNSPNQLMISLKKDGSNRNVHLYIGERQKTFKCNSEWISGEWYHLCATWFGPAKVVKAYQNGIVCMNTESNIPTFPTTISSGGILIIGQEQDAMDARYQANESWHGDIADLQIWNEVFDIVQIRETGECNRSRKAGNVFSWMKTPMIAIGNVVFSETQLCYS